MFGQNFIPVPPQPIPPKNLVTRVGILRKISGKYVVETPYRVWTTIPDRMGKTTRTWLKWAWWSLSPKSKAERLVGRFVRVLGMAERQAGGYIDPYNTTVIVYQIDWLKGRLPTF